MSDEKDPQRISDSADNCEVLRARLAKYEDAEWRPLHFDIASERDSFEQFCAGFHRGSSLDGEIHSDPRYPTLNGQWIYDDWNVQSAWATWQARAALTTSAPNHCEQVRAWNLAVDELPANGKPVLAYYLNSHGMGRRIRAMHVKRFTVEAEEFADPDTQCVEYSEQDDCYYTTEGWYELIDNWPDYASCAVIEGVITHWMPLPSAPSAGSQEQGE